MSHIKRTKSSRILLGFVLGFVLIGFYIPAQRYRETARIEKIVKELSSRYGLVIRYGNPSEFCIPPLPPDDNKAVEIEPVDKAYVLVALEGIKAALKVYPPVLIRRYLSALFIAGTIKIFGVEGAATYHNSWIYISAPRSDQLGPQSYALSIHHELSSLFFYGAHFPLDQWVAVNSPGFRYLKRRIDVIRAAAVENRRDPKEATQWYQEGFVSDYGMTSAENDLNTYAEFAMGQPAKLIKLAKQYPRIAQKTKIIVNFYCNIAPELSQYFKSAGLMNNLDGLH